MPRSPLARPLSFEALRAELEPPWEVKKIRNRTRPNALLFTTALSETAFLQGLGAKVVSFLAEQDLDFVPVVRTVSRDEAGESVPPPRHVHVYTAFPMTAERVETLREAADRLNPLLDEA